MRSAVCSPGSWQCGWGWCWPGCCSTAAAMKIEGEAQRVRVYIGESDQWHGKPLFTAIVERCRQEGLAGTTVLRGIEGYGAHTRIHTARILRLAEDLPVVVDIIDRAERIERLLPILDE